MNEEVFQAKGDLMKSIQTFLEKFNCISFEEKPKILLQAWYNFFAIQHAQPENPNELFLKLLEDLKELAEYDNSLSRDRPIFFDDNEDHSVQNKEYLENSSNEIATSNSNQEKEGPPQDSNICQIIREEYCIEVCEEQKQKMENTMLELVEICRQKELYCMHDNVEDIIESALNSKLLSINLNSQRLDKKKQESSISLNNTSQISPVYAIAPILSNKEPEYSLSMGYEHPNTTLETESDKVIKFGVEELVPILNKYEVTSEDKRECDVLVCEDSSTFDVCDNHSNILSDSNNDDDILSDDNAFEDIEYVEASLPNPEIASLEEENDESYNSLSFSDNSLPEFETFSDLTKETRSGSTITHADNSLPEYDPFCFEIEPDQGKLTSAVMNDIFDWKKSIYFLLLIIRYHREPPNDEFDLELEVISAVMKNIDELNKDECFYPGGEIDVSTNDEDVDYFPFTFVIQIFLPYLIYPEVSPLFLPAESEDTIFDLGIFV
uniref:Uncharacterized protein n=1 Tax=Tanacetum cinerariifolium TaxID=118510 RepID=A0A699HY09_TANCI|nr:hypothetical protein [Tanacetum cinerariifolium]